MKTTLSRLPNHVRVATCEMPHAQSVTMGIWTEVGGRYEPAKWSGISHFIEHLLFKGTARRSARQISQAVEGVGGYLNAFTAEEHTCYHAAAAAEYAPKVFDVLADMYLHARFASQDIERERGVISEEILMYRDEPAQLVQEILSETIWPAHALGRPLTGSLQSVARMQREDFVEFRRRHYHGGSTLVTMAGRITHEAAEQLAQPLADLPLNRRTAPATAPASTDAPRWSVLAKATEQTQLALAFPAFSVHDERRHALGLLHTILGGNMSSRLFQELRERRGLCYSVGTHLVPFSDTGALVVSCGLDAKSLEKTMDILRREWAKLRTIPVSRQELQRAKDYTIGMSRMSLEKTSSQNARLGFSVLTYGKITDSEEIHERIRSVSIEAITEVAAEILQEERLTTAIVGPVDEAVVRQL